MLDKQVGNLLGLANISRNIVTGEKVINVIRNNTAKLIIIAEDASDNTKKKYTDKCKSYEVPYVIMGTSDELSHAIHKDNRVCIAIMDANFANKIVQKG